MKKLLLAGLASAAIALPVAAALQTGDTAPMFTARASLAGKEFNYSLADALKQGPVVVYFYPSAYTQGCNIQARTFSENMEAFNAAKATVIGVSLDSIQRLSDFSADPEYCAGKVAVASDTDGAIAKSFGVDVGAMRAGMTDTRGQAIEILGPPGDGHAHRCVVYFDRQTKLPVRFEAYERPRPDGPPGGELLECYSYLGLRFNVNLPDETFDK